MRNVLVPFPDIVLDILILLSTLSGILFWKESSIPHFKIGR